MGKATQFNVVLDDGRCVWVEAMYLRQTYAGFIQGSRAWMNEKIVARMRDKRVWAAVPQHAVVPEWYPADTDRRFPQWTVDVVMTSYPVRGGSGDVNRDEQSYLTVSLMTDTPFEPTVAAFLRTSLAAIPWESAAENSDIL
ncbi:MAG: hypothetical protein KDJ41_07830 [Hyphomicrobiaceae bacterium]|nr:hypothetical protein [Hyphomicrobiaceae bacterium]